MSEIAPFQFPATGQTVRTVTIDGEPWFVLADVAKILGYRDGEHAGRLVRAHQINTLSQGIAAELGQRGGRPPKAVTEGGLYRLVMRSDVAMAEPFQDWVTDEVLPAIRRTGRYEVGRARELSRRDLAQMVIAEADRADQAEHRAELAEGTVREIEGANGLTFRMFHKKYFSDVREREFFEHLYAKGYLIDQRGKGSVRPDGSVRDGSEHRHPGFKGKPFLYLHFVGVHGERRRESARVRPGQPELDFKAALVREGLQSNSNDDGFLFGIEGGAG